jgi:hypothetical protein
MEKDMVDVYEVIVLTFRSYFDGPHLSWGGVGVLPQIKKTFRSYIVRVISSLWCFIGLLG